MGRCVRFPVTWLLLTRLWADVGIVPHQLLSTERLGAYVDLVVRCLPYRPLFAKSGCLLRQRICFDSPGSTGPAERILDALSASVRPGQLEYFRRAGTASSIVSTGMISISMYSE